MIPDDQTGMSPQEIELREFLKAQIDPRFLNCSLLEQVKAFVIQHKVRTLTTRFEKSEPKVASSIEEVPTEAAYLDKLSEDQKEAWLKLKVWVHTDQPYFVLKGFAGTGKTFLLKMLINDPSTKVKTYIFTAPTNKAKKVIAVTLGVRAQTTYSALGLRMVETEDGLQLEFSDTPPYIPRGSTLVVDEGSMVGRELRQAVDQARIKNGCKVLYVGDPAQLPPVNETSSKVWKATEDDSCKAMLRKVMRFDNQLLTLSVKIRQCLKDKQYTTPVQSDNDDCGGVYLLGSKAKFEQAILRGIDTPSDFKDRKIIAWRNKTVGHYNDIVRQHLGFKDRFCVGDQLLIAEPIEINGRILANVDDEVTVKAVRQGSVTEPEGGIDIPVWSLTVDGDVSLVLNVAIDDSELKGHLSLLAGKAKTEKGSNRKDAWAKFWRFKRMFHQVRYGWAITAHRSQGSTYENVFVDQMDILANSDKRTAFKCLYTAFTRPTTRAFTY